MAPVNPLDTPICLMSPSRIATSAWLDHVPFGMLIIDLLRPQQIVELGTHTGVSYCAFCQAVKVLEIDARAYAIATWQDDSQTGLVGDEVLQELRTYHDPLYASFSRLVQSSFDDAVKHFSEKSIDLLHIDGDHSYAAVKHQWERWLPKMSDRGIVLVHGTNRREADCEVWRLWEEMKPQYRHFEFIHGQGLGVVLVGTDVPAPVEEWLTAAGQKPSPVRDLFAQLGQRLAMRQQLHQERQAESATAFRAQVESLQARFEAERAALAARLEILRVERERERAAGMEQVAAMRTAHETARADLVAQAEAHLQIALEALRVELQSRHEAALEALRAELQGRHEAALEALRAELQSRHEAALTAYQADLAEMRVQQEAQFAALQARHKTELAELQKSHESALAMGVRTLQEERQTAEAHFARELTAWQQRAFAAEEAHTALRNTRSMKVVSGWWHTKAAVGDAVAHRAERSQVLLHRSADMWRTEGTAAVAGRLGRWLRGERRYYGPNALIRTTQQEQSRQMQAADRMLALQAPQRTVDGSAPNLPPVSASTTDEPPAQRPQEEVGRARLRAFLAAGQVLAFPYIEQPQVSIVIPVHNQAHYTYLLLENLLATGQGLPFEVIIIDDASSDDTALLLEQLENVRSERNASNLGFGETCNRGAALARGAYLCFLNNDTLPMPGWLEALVEVMEQYPRCGAVGAKIVFPDMRLQEAGCIAWRDGYALGYGRGDDPYSPPYNYVREVDFCSAACLLVRSALFHTLGGFDPRYAPAYYEDADLCLAIRQAGHAVVFAPRAVIFHLEHATSGRGNAIALQLRNREVFLDKWRERLATHGMPGPLSVLQCRDSRRGQRVLILDDVVPMMRLGSGFPRTVALINALVETGYVVTYLPATDPRPYEPATTNLQELGVEVLYGRTDIAEAVRDRTALYDIVIVSRPHNAWLIAVAREANPQALIIYDAEAVFTLREARQAEVEGTPLPTALIEARIREELSVAASANVVLTVSQLERRAIRQYYPELSVGVWGHAVSIRDLGPDFAARSGLLFMGYLTSGPNNDALLYLFREILPAVVEKLDCRVTVVGQGALPEALDAATRFSTRVDWAGFVEDLGAVFDRHRVFVAPHRYAAGIPIKVIEAMAYGVPCVISELLAEQLGVTDGVEALVAHNPKEFSKQVVQLHEDAALWGRIRDAGRDFVRANYDPQTMKHLLVDMITEEARRNRRE